jgi:hypothetical protein
LPPYPEPIAAILASFGKAKAKQQLPLPGAEGAPDLARAASTDPEILKRVAEVQRDFRARLAEVVEAAALPHELPPVEIARQASVGLASGPKKPALEHAFKPLGYHVKGESGTFMLRRRSPLNLAVSVYLDVGTWSNSLTGSFAVQGVGYAARLPLPPSKAALGVMQYPIGDAERWQKIVENLAALVKELDRTFVPAIEAVAGPAPEWFEPQR